MSSDSTNVTEGLESNSGSINDPEMTSTEAIDGKFEDQIAPQLEEEPSSCKDSRTRDAKPLSNVYLQRGDRL